MMKNKPRNMFQAFWALLLSLCLLSLPALADPGSTPAAFAQEVQTLVSRHWPGMKDVWPGCDYGQHRLLLMYVDDEGRPKQAWLLSPEGMKEMEAQEYQATEAPQAGDYSAVTVEGSPAVAMSFDDYSLSQPREAEQVYRTATHELVHFYHQEAAVQTGGSRAQPYPLNPTPRFYRMMIYQNLIKAPDQPENRNPLLGQARHWLDKWQAEFQEESDAVKDTDIVEGTARYIENLGAVAVPGISGEALLQGALQAIEREVLFAAADEESYELGYVAALLLDQTRQGWKEGFYQQHLTPVELLLKGVKPLAQAPDEGMWERVRAEAEAVNRETAPQLKDILAAQKDRAILYLKIDVTDAAGSYEARGNYLVEQQDVITGFTAMYKVGAGSVMIRNSSVLSRHTEDGRVFILLPLTMAHTVNDGVLSIQSQDVVAEQVQASTEEEEGRTVYTVVAGTK